MEVSGLTTEIVIFTFLTTPEYVPVVEKDLLVFPDPEIVEIVQVPPAKVIVSFPI